MKIKTVWINPLLRIDSLPPTFFSQQHPLITPPFLGPGEKYLQPPSSFYLFWNQVTLHKVSSPWFLYPPPEGYILGTQKLVSKKRDTPPKTNMEPANDGFLIEISTSRASFSGEPCYFSGVYPWKSTSLPPFSKNAETSLLGRCCQHQPINRWWNRGFPNRTKKMVASWTSRDIAFLLTLHFIILWWFLIATWNIPVIKWSLWIYCSHCHRFGDFLFNKNYHQSQTIEVTT